MLRFVLADYELVASQDCMGANTSKTTPRAWREAGQLGADRAAAADVEDTALERLDEPDDDSEDKA